MTYIYAFSVFLFSKKTKPQVKFAKKGVAEKKRKKKKKQKKKTSNKQMLLYQFKYM